MIADIYYTLVKGDNIIKIMFFELIGTPTTHLYHVTIKLNLYKTVQYNKNIHATDEELHLPENWTFSESTLIDNAKFLARSTLYHNYEVDLEFILKVTTGLNIPIYPVFLKGDAMDTDKLDTRVLEEALKLQFLDE